MDTASEITSPPSYARMPAALRRIQRQEKLVLFGFVVPVLLLLIGLFIYPVAAFLAQSLFDPGFTLKHYERIFSSPVYLRVLWVTVETSGLTTIGCLLFGYPVAYLLANSSSGVRKLLLPFILIPFWTNILVRLYAWLILLGHGGVINQWLQGIGLIDHPLPMLFNQFGVLVGMIHYMLPFMILPLYSVMSGIPTNLVPAANTLGAGPYRAFLRIYLPLSLPGVGAGSILVFIISSGFFVTPALLGGPQNTMISQLIEEQVAETFNWGFASALSALLLVVGLVFYIGYSKFISPERIYGKG